ncbi:MAG: GtrA family protein [Rhodospirillaceae bacterium]
MATFSSIADNLASNQFARFIVVGVINTAFGYCVFAALILLDVTSILALFISTTLGILFNYKTTGRLVFRWRDGGRLLPFFCVYVATFCLNIYALWSLEAWGVRTLTAQALLLPAMVIISYTLIRVLVFCPLGIKEQP